MQLYFNSEGKDIFVGESKNRQDIFKMMRDFLSLQKVDFMYIREYTIGNDTFLDYGSHSNKFKIKYSAL